MRRLSRHRAKSLERCPWFSDDIFAKWLVRHLVTFGDSLLDVGAGTGFMLPFYRAAFSPVLALEPSKAAGEILKRRAEQQDIAVLDGVAEYIPIEDGEVDIAIAKSSLHHFTDIWAGLREMARVASVVAIVEVVAPSSACLPFLSEILLRKESTRSGATIFTEDKLKDYVRGIGLSPRVLYFDQYIEVNRWLENSDLDMDSRKDVLQCILVQEGQVRVDMQIHSRGEEVVMLRRMGLIIGH